MTLKKGLIDDEIQLRRFINLHMKRRKNESERNGEIFTPLFLIEEMLDELDNHYKKIKGCGATFSIFSNEKLKWGDIVGCGRGNFSLCLYFRLMEGLKNVIIDKKERKKHIIENMLYMAELNEESVRICKRIFDINDEYKLNLYVGDALKLNVKEIWNIDKFDVILGNPPFNRGGIYSHHKKRNGIKFETLWHLFVKKSLENLKSYLVFITPLYWMKKTHPIHNLMGEKSIIWMKLYDSGRTQKIMKACIPISFYILKNEINNNQITKVISEINNLKIRTTSHTIFRKDCDIPLGFHSIFNKLSDFITNHNLQLEYSTLYVNDTGKHKPLPKKYSLKDNLGVSTYRIKDGIIVSKMEKEHIDTRKRKLIFSNKKKLIGMFIDDGRLGISGRNNIYILGDNLELMLKYVKFKIFSFLSCFIKYNMELLEHALFEYMPDIRKLGIINIEEDEFYTLIGLSEKEKKAIYEA